MTTDYSIDTCKELEKIFQDKQLHRPMRVERYDAGDVLTYSITPLEETDKTQRQVRLLIKKFVGGGFAGQVYQVEILTLQGHPIKGLEAGKKYDLYTVPFVEIVPTHKIAIVKKDGNIILHEAPLYPPKSWHGNKK